mmetsp:Transcript_20697/g.57209  ORF Transcript_20697/g.57209 Transcript_20697/m.57209 type:complete len:270 (+) Transcript_20697:1887-2696(+)
MQGTPLALAILYLAANGERLLGCLLGLARQALCQLHANNELQGSNLHLFVAPLLEECQGRRGCLQPIGQRTILQVADCNPQGCLALGCLVPNLPGQRQRFLCTLLRILNAILRDVCACTREHCVHRHLLVSSCLEELSGLLEGLQGLPGLVLREVHLADGEERGGLAPLVALALEGCHLGGRLLQGIVQLALKAVGTVQEAEAVLLPLHILYLPEERQRFHGTLRRLIALTILHVLLSHGKHQGRLPGLCPCTRVLQHCAVLRGQVVGI